MWKQPGLIYTSGTTGQPKGVMLTHGNIVSNAVATTQIVPVSEQDRLLSVLPLAHAYECTLGLVIPVMCGAAVYYLDRPPTASVLQPALESVKPTMMLTVPLIIEKVYKKSIPPQLNRSAVTRTLYRFLFTRRMLNRIAGRKLKAHFGGRMRFFGVGGAPLAPEVEQFLREARFP